MSNRVGSAAYHDKESLLHVLHERAALAPETRPSTTHLLYRVRISCCVVCTGSVCIYQNSLTPLYVSTSF